MKKLFLSFMIVLFSSFAFAQNHMLFMGVELNATPESFAQKIENKGFNAIKGVNNAFEGKYEGLKCELTVSARPQTNVVYQVDLSFPASMSSDAVWNLMQKLLDTYGVKDKDGKYTNVLASEPGSIEIRTDQGGVKMHYKKYSAEEQKQFKAEGHYGLIYFDKINTEKK